MTFDLETEVMILQLKIKRLTGRSAFVKFTDTDDEALFKEQSCTTTDPHGILNDCEYLDGTGECSYQDDDVACPRCRAFWVFNYGEAKALEVCGEAKSEA